MSSKNNFDTELLTLEKLFCVLRHYLISWFHFQRTVLIQTQKYILPHTFSLWTGMQPKSCDQVKGQELSSLNVPLTSPRLLQSERARASSCPIRIQLKQITPFTNRLTGWAGLHSLIRSPHWPNLPSLQSGSMDRNTSQSNGPIPQHDPQIRFTGGQNVLESD